MKISKSNSVSKVDDVVVSKTIMEFFINSINLLTIIRGDECTPLTARMKRFYVASIIHYNMGITNPISESALQIYKKYYKESINKQLISDLLGRISKRNWITYDKEERSINVHPLYRKVDLKSLSFNFNVTLNYNEQT